jgi:hypothetical protein
MQIQSTNANPELTVIEAIGKPSSGTANACPQSKNCSAFKRISDPTSSHNSGLVNPMRCPIFPDITSALQSYATFEARSVNIDVGRITSERNLLRLGDSAIAPLWCLISALLLIGYGS